MVSVRGADVPNFLLRNLILTLVVAWPFCVLKAQDFPVENSPDSAKTKTLNPELSEPGTTRNLEVLRPVHKLPEPIAADTPITASELSTAGPEEIQTLSDNSVLIEDLNQSAPATSGNRPKRVVLNPDLEHLPSLDATNFVSALEAVPTRLEPLELLGEMIQPGTRHELRWESSQSFDGAVVVTPVIVLHGAKPGPRLCLTAAIHGDELNGIEIIRRVVNEIEVDKMSGTVIGVPIVNYLGYSRATRYLPDRRDLNRYFPGTRYGSAASRIANSFFTEVARHCHALVDFHTGSFDRSNLPQVRGDLRIPAVRAFTRGFGATVVLHSPGSPGMLRHALSEVGIPAVTFEVGAPARLEPADIDFGLQAIHTLLHKMGMTRSFRMWAEPQALFYAAKWVRVDTGGLLFSEVKLGDRVRVGQRLGKVIDPIQNIERGIISPVRGKVLGMALNQIVLPGFAAFHLGVETDEQRMAEEAARSAAVNPDANGSIIEDPAEDESISPAAERLPDDEDDER